MAENNLVKQGNPTEAEAFINKEEEEAILENCDHISKFVDELKKCDTKAMSVAAKRELLASKRKILEFLEIQEELSKDPELIEVNSSDDKERRSTRTNEVKAEKVHKDQFDDSSDSEAELQKRMKKLWKNERDQSTASTSPFREQKSVLEVLVDKLDTRKVPL